MRDKMLVRLAGLAAAILAAAGLWTMPAMAEGRQPDFAGTVYVQEARSLLEQNPNLPYSPNTLLVRFAPGTPEADRAQARAMVKGTRLHQYGFVPGLEAVGTHAGVDRSLALLRKIPSVLYAEPDYVVRAGNTPNDTYFGLLWGLNNTGQTVNGDEGTAGADIRASQAWDITTGGPSFVIAVIDTGIQMDHPDLADNIWTNPGESGLDSQGRDRATNGVDDDSNGYIDDVHGWDFYSNDNNPRDQNGHGTHTAGTIGAVGNNGIGVTGVNWRCKLMPLRFLGPSGSGYTSDAVLAVEYATDMGVKVSNNSWGGGGFSQSLYNAINGSKAVGHLFVAAAGNSGINTDSSPSYPASYNLDNVISVAATDNDDRLASFSNYGAASVDLGAPGVNIASTYPTNQYAYLSGTSMACPHVAGVAALVYAANPTWTYDQVRDRIFGTVRPVSSLAGKTVTGGVVDALAALTGTPSPPPPSPPNAPSSLALTKVSGGVQVSWQDNSNNELGFRIERQQKIGRNWTNSTTVETTLNPYTDSFVGNGTFRYRVQAFNIDGSSAWTGWKNIKL